MKYFILIFLIFPFLVFPQMKSKLDIIIESQIPENELTTLTTDELLDKCLDYPYLVDVMFAENIPLMFKYIRKEFNGFDEFFERQNAAEVIQSRFLNFDFQMVNDLEKDYEKGLYNFKFCYLNLLLAQEETINGLGDKYKVLYQINKKYSETDNQSLASFRTSVTGNFVGYSILKYLEKTEIGKNPEISSLVKVAHTIHIGSLDYHTFNNLIDFVTMHVKGE